MTEFEIIALLKRTLPAKGLVLGVGDYCAIYRSHGAREDLVFTTDQLHEDPSASGVGAFLHGGEDYELLYRGRDLPGIAIGTIIEDPPGLVSCRGFPLAPLGWDHFRSGYNDGR